MSKRSERLYLGDMLEHSRLAHARVAGVSREHFLANTDLQIIVMHHVQIIGEAAGKVSPAIRKAHPEVPWSDITGMRHRIVHNYFEINADVLWTTATERLPDLIAALEKFTPPEPPSA
ncbi:MAG TPA: HepT-like ribonuclease domain-containing protein [Thermoanaerobaculia bacterium]